MDTSFDLVALLRKEKQQPTTKSHKIRPTQFVSVAGGVQKRLETNIKNRKSSRLSVFDRIRNITKCESPKAPTLSDAQQKALHRKQQLEKWKEEKDKKKKEAAAQKKKPFVSGMPQRKTFGPPPPPKPMPCTSGRVTRSQARQKPESKPSNTQTKSFAPSNATFKPSIFLNTEVPTLAPTNKKKVSKPKHNITFEPVLAKNLQKETRTTRTTRAKPVANKSVIDSKKKTNEKTKAKVLVKPPPLKKQMFQSSSSSSDMEQPSRLRSKPSLRKSITKTKEKPLPAQASTFQDSDCVLQETVSMSSQDSQDASMSQDTASTSSQDELSTPRNKFPKSESSSEEKLRSPKAVDIPLTPKQIAEVAKNISPCVTMSRGKDNASESSSEEKLRSPKAVDIPLTPEQIAEVAKNISPCVTMSRGMDNASESSSEEKLRSPKAVDIPLTPEQIAEVAKNISPCVTMSRGMDNASESSSEEKLCSPKAVDIPLTPEQIAEVAKNISPCVTMSRGKDNARKEMKKKLEEGLLDEDNSKMESVNHFHRQLNSEIARITAMCDNWDQISAQTVMPEPVQELVLTAVGQARLLMSQKLQQFAVLLECCARPVPGAPLVTPADLHGFWDMVFMQVENVDMRFKNLEELRLRDWIEEQIPVAKKVVAKPAAKKVAAKPTGGPSRLREMIAAARKAKKVQESQSENSESDKSESAASLEIKTFEAGFFRVSSPMKRSPAPGTPSNKNSLLKTVLSSEAKKSVSKNSTSFAMLRASLMSKNVDIDGVSPLMQTPTIIITPVNFDATPTRSILKQNNPISTKKPDKLKTVLFHEGEPSSHASRTSCDAEPGVAPLPADDKENKTSPKPASSRKSRLSRQNATDQPSPVMTRSRRKSVQTPLEDTTTRNTRSTRKSVYTPLAESDGNVKRNTRKAKEAQEMETPKRSTRRRKSTVAI